MNSTERLDAIQDLMEEILQIQKENSKDTTVVERVQEIIQKSSRLVEKSESANEIVIDAKILHTGSQVLNSNITSFDTNLTSFNEVEYAKGILNYLRNNSNGITLEKSWECLGPVTYDLYSKSTPATYMLGSVSLEPSPVKEKVRHERTRKVAEAVTKLSQGSDNSGEEKSGIEENIYEHILKSLVKCYRTNNKKPIPYIDFIMDPHSYWKSVENIFYFSFLVRDGRVNMLLNDEGLPAVEPVMKSDVETTAKKAGNQFSFSLSQQDWKDCVKKFNISHAKIRPFKRIES